MCICLIELGVQADMHSCLPSLIGKELQDAVCERLLNYLDLCINWS